MLRIRRFEERAATLYRDGEIPGFVHLSVGQEAVAVGTCSRLATTDLITSTHRGHGHVLAKGADMRAMFAELLGRDGGTCRGRGGSMHIADVDVGVLGANGIVGAGLPIAVGAALQARRLGRGAVVAAFFGDGATAQGAFHEAVNLAALWRLPVLFVCENNGFAEFSPTADLHPVPLLARAAGYGIEGHAVDGHDVLAVADLVGALAARCRQGDGPFFVEATTVRPGGHYEGDPQRYRDPEGDAPPVDPIERSAVDLERDGVAPAALAALRAEVDEEVEAAVEWARRSPPPPAGELRAHVFGAQCGPATGPQPEAEDDAPEDVRVLDAVRDALRHELEDDPDVFLMGVDIGRGGNVFTVTRGLHEQWPERVLDTPISETAIVGAGIGAALTGGRPIVEVMYIDFLGVCLDQIMNQAAKLRYMSGGRVGVPLTIRTQFGAGRSAAGQHSQSLEALLCHIPGLRVVMPSNPRDAYGLLRAAVRDPDPVVVVEHRHLYSMRGPKPARGHLTEIGKAAVVRPGRDVTVVAASRMVHEAVAAADELAAAGIEVEVIDLRTVSPLDLETIARSVDRTSRLLVAHEAVRDFGIGAEIAANVAEHGFWNLDGPVVRVGAPPTPAPYAPALETEWLPGARHIVGAVRRMLAS